MRKKFLLMMLIMVMLCFVACSQKPNFNEPWDQLGGGGSGEQTEESGITTEDISKNEAVEEPNEDFFETSLESAISIDLNSLKENSEIYSYKDNILTIENEGVYSLSGNLSGALVVKGDAQKVVIILNNASIQTMESQNIPAITFEKHSGERILSAYQNTINKLGDSIGDNEFGEGAIIQAKKSSLVINGSGTLELNANGVETTAIKVKKELSIYSSTILINTTDHGIKSGELLSIHNANINITAEGDGMKTDVEAESIEEGNEYTSNPYAGYIYIKNSNISITSGDDGISANSLLKINNTDAHTINIITNGGAPQKITETSSDSADGKAIKVDGITLVVDEEETTLLSKCENNYSLYILGGKFIINSNDDAISSKGNLIVDNGTFDISSGDDGIHAEYITKINNGNIKINKCYEGIEGASVEILNGIINITSADDGINAANSDLVNYPYNIYIGGGNITVNAEGDGVDSNGTIEFTGGTTVIYGPTNGGNGSLDADKGILVNGGILVAVGPMGMIETPASNSKQCSICYGVSVNANSKLVVKDGEGNVLFETTSPKSYQSVVVSMPDFSIGSTYSILAGTSTKTFKIESILTSTIGGSGGIGRPGEIRPPRK